MTTQGFFRSAMDALAFAWQRQADRYLTGALLMLDDKELAKRGYSRAELKKRPAAINMF